MSKYNIWIKLFSHFYNKQKQPFRGVLTKTCSENMQQTPIENTHEKLFIKIALWHGYSPVYVLHIHLFIRTPLEGCFWMNTNRTVSEELPHGKFYFGKFPLVKFLYGKLPWGKFPHGKLRRILFSMFFCWKNTSPLINMIFYLPLHHYIHNIHQNVQFYTQHQTLWKEHDHENQFRTISFIKT